MDSDPLLYRPQPTGPHFGQAPGAPPEGTARQRRRRQVIIGAACAVIVAAGVTAAVAVTGSGTGSRHAATSRLSASRQVRTGKVAASGAAAAPSPARPLLAGQQGSRQEVPWSQVGPGWMLASWNPSRPARNGARTATGTPVQEPTPTTLFLIDPAGGRYDMATLPAEPADSTVPRNLVAWSGDGQRALLDSSMSADVAVLDLRTGTSKEFSLGAGVQPVGFTAPDGLAIVANAGADPAHPRLERFSLTGTLEHAYPVTFPGNGSYNGVSAIFSADGTELAVSTSQGIELMTNDGQAIRALTVSSSVRYCTPLRWWAPGELLASCLPAGRGVQQLWLMPTSGARPSALTASPPAPGDDGDLDAWRLPGDTYVQDAGGCGYVYLAKLNPGGLTTRLPVPGVPAGDSTVVTGAYGSELAIEAVSACGGGSSLLWFNPAANSVTPLLGGSANGGFGSRGLLFGDTNDYGDR